MQLCVSRSQCTADMPALLCWHTLRQLDQDDNKEEDIEPAGTGHVDKLRVPCEGDTTAVCVFHS